MHADAFDDDANFGEALSNDADGHHIYADACPDDATAVQHTAMPLMAATSALMRALITPIAVKPTAMALMASTCTLMPALMTPIAVKRSALALMATTSTLMPALMTPIAAKRAAMALCPPHPC